MRGGGGGGGAKKTRSTPTASTAGSRLSVEGFFFFFLFNGPLRQYFSLHGTVSRRKKREKVDEAEMSKQAPPAPYARTEGPCLLLTPWH